MQKASGTDAVFPDLYAEYMETFFLFERRRQVHLRTAGFILLFSAGALSCSVLCMLFFSMALQGIQVGILENVRRVLEHFFDGGGMYYSFGVSVVLWMASKYVSRMLEKNSSKECSSEENLLFRYYYESPIEYRTRVTKAKHIFEERFHVEGSHVGIKLEPVVPAKFLYFKDSEKELTASDVLEICMDMDTFKCSYPTAYHRWNDIKDRNTQLGSWLHPNEVAEQFMTVQLEVFCGTPAHRRYRFLLGNDAEAGSLYEALVERLPEVCTNIMKDALCGLIRDALREKTAFTGVDIQKKTERMLLETLPALIEAGSLETAV